MVWVETGSGFLVAMQLTEVQLPGSDSRLDGFQVNESRLRRWILFGFTIRACKLQLHIYTTIVSKHNRKQTITAPSIAEAARLLRPNSGNIIVLSFAGNMGVLGTYMCHLDEPCSLRQILHHLWHNSRAWVEERYRNIYAPTDNAEQWQWAPEHPQAPYQPDAQGNFRLVQCRAFASTSEVVQRPKQRWT